MKEYNYKENWMDFEYFKKEFQKVTVEEYPNNVLAAVPNPKVTVRITTYQHVNFIKDTIEGILIQKTDFPFELIIGDDESTDGTREICIEYAKQYPNLIRLFLHKRENNIKVLGKPCGIFQITYNLFQSRGEFIAGCSGDDYWTDPLKLQKQYDFMSKNPGYSYCYHCFRYKYESDNKNGPIFEKINKTDRIQSLLYRNVFHRIPKEFVSVISEDTFIKFILSIEGRKKYIEGISPSICRIHENNIWGVTRKGKNFNEQTKGRVDTWQKIQAAFKNTKYEKKAKLIVSQTIIIDTIINPEINIFKKMFFVISTRSLYKVMFNLLIHKVKKLIRIK